MGLTREQLKQKAFREKENKRKREWRLRKKLEAEQQKTRPPRISSPQVHRPAPPDEEVYTKAEVKELMLRFARENLNLPEPEPPKLSRHARKLLKRRERLLAKLKDTEEPPEEAKHPITIEQAEQIQKEETHFKGKKPLQFAKTAMTVEPEPMAKPKRRLRWRATPSPQELFAEAIPEAQAPHSTAQGLDITEEQLLNPMTTIWCPESIKEDGMADVKRHPELYIEINVVKKSRVVDTFYIDAEKKIFHYKKKECKVKEDAIYLLPTKLGAFMPTTYYKEGDPDPKGFKQTNKGITGKALSLLYMEQLYTSLLYSEDVKYNFFIVILSIAILIAYGIGCYFLFSGAWMVKPTPAGGGVPITTILLPWLGRF